MRRTQAIVLAALCALSLSAVARSEWYIARSGDDWVRVADKPCDSRILQKHKVPEGQRGYFRGALAQIDGVIFSACWVTHGDQLRVLYEDGDTGNINIDDFSEDGA